MADRVAPGPAESPASIRQAVCVNTRKIFDSCRDKDCVDNLRVYPTESSLGYIDGALSIRPKTAELLYVDVNVEPVSFNRGYYTVDCSYFYRVTGETFPKPSVVPCCPTIWAHTRSLSRLWKSITLPAQAPFRWQTPPPALRRSAYNWLAPSPSMRSWTPSCSSFPSR